MESEKVVDILFRKMLKVLSDHNESEKGGRNIGPRTEPQYTSSPSFQVSLGEISLLGPAPNALYVAPGILKRSSERVRLGIPLRNRSLSIELDMLGSGGTR